jgi:Ca-activated chloride channel family protein
MRRSLPHLRRGDSFRIVRFSDTASEWSREPLAATPENVAAGLRYIDSLVGGGGTVMTSGIRTALAPSVPHGALRLVVFLTDGYIGNDVEIVRLIQQQRGEARFFSFGVGNGVNRYLMQEIARVGRGAARIVRPDEDAELAADELVARLASPIWTDVEIDWGDAPVSGATPKWLPDLFLGQSLRVLARFEGDGAYSVTLRAKRAGVPVALPLQLTLETSDLARDSSTPSALPAVWARSQVDDRMVSYLDPGRDAEHRAMLREEVTELGLAHRLVTQWTSFVAVAKPVVNPGGAGFDADVAVPRVADVSDLAYPPDALRGGKSRPTLMAAGDTGLGAANGFTGSAAPEPGTTASLLALAFAATATFCLSRRRRVHGSHDSTTG